jgi:hypothetical protein
MTMLRDAYELIFLWLEAIYNEIRNYLRRRCMEPVFEIFKDKAGEFRFNLRAVNGEIVASSEGYASKQACKDTVKVIKKLARTARVEDLTE